MVSNPISNMSYGVFLATAHGTPNESEGIIPDAECNVRETSSQSQNTTHLKNKDRQYKLEIVWRNVIIFVILHSTCIYSFFMAFTGQLAISTLIFTYFYLMFAGFGITAGAHRLWAHRSYTANLPLRIFLMMAQSAALQNDIHEWVRDHRVHHKFTDTDADPHNASRGFFFSHIGWLMCKKHRDVVNKGKSVDMKDVLSDPVVRFQMRYYVPLVLLLTIIIPTYIPWYFFGENIWVSFVLCLGRYTLSLNGTWLVNSAAHIWGMKPYDRSIKPSENKFVSIVAFGEGWHNYHHVFPWDYKTAELGNYRWNFTTCFLDLMAKIGWATDLKTASEEIIRKRVLRTGEKSELEADKHHHHNHEGELIWGWGDKDMHQDEVQEIKRMNRHIA